MPSAYLQWRFHSGERVVARGPLVLISSQNQMLWLGPNTCIHWTSNYGTGIAFIGNMLSWLGFHNFVQ